MWSPVHAGGQPQHYPRRRQVCLARLPGPPRSLRDMLPLWRLRRRVLRVGSGHQRGCDLEQVAGRSHGWLLIHIRLRRLPGIAFDVEPCQRHRVERLFDLRVCQNAFRADQFDYALATPVSLLRRLRGTLVADHRVECGHDVDRALQMK